MNLTNIINAISREMEKELKKAQQSGLESMNFKEAAGLCRNTFDRAASIVVSREFDKFRKTGPKKGGE